MVALPNWHTKQATLKILQFHSSLFHPDQAPTKYALCLQEPEVNYTDGATHNYAIHNHEHSSTID